MKTVLCLFVVAAFIATGEALKCYDCIAGNPGCDDFDKSDAGVIEDTCLPTITECLKITKEIEGTTLTSRSCSPNVATSGPNRMINFGYKRDVYTCKTDLCNGVSSTGATLTTLMVLIAPLIFRN